MGGGLVHAMEMFSPVLHNLDCRYQSERPGLQTHPAATPKHVRCFK